MSKNSRQLASFSEYCREHPTERLLQAMRNWLGVDFLLTADYDKQFGEEGHTTTWDTDTIKDTFYDIDTLRELAKEV